MADIVQLEEKGNLLYPKTHTSAIDGLDETVVKKTGNEDITGVKNFKDGLQSNGIEVVKSKPYKRTQYTNLLNGVTGFVEVEKVNGFITIRVSAKTNKEVTAGWLNILKLPNEYRIAQDKVQYGVPDPSSTGYPHQLVQVCIFTIQVTFILVSGLLIT